MLIYYYLTAPASTLNTTNVYDNWLRKLSTAQDIREPENIYITPQQPYSLSHAGLSQTPQSLAASTYSIPPAESQGTPRIGMSQQPSQNGVPLSGQVPIDHISLKLQSSESQQPAGLQTSPLATPISTQTSHYSQEVPVQTSQHIQDMLTQTSHHTQDLPVQTSNHAQAVPIQTSNHVYDMPVQTSHYARDMPIQTSYYTQNVPTQVSQVLAFSSRQQLPSAQVSQAQPPNQSPTLEDTNFDMSQRNISPQTSRYRQIVSQTSNAGLDGVQSIAPMHVRNITSFITH